MSPPRWLLHSLLLGAALGRRLLDLRDALGEAEARQAASDGDGQTPGSIIWVPGITSSALWAHWTGGSAPPGFQSCWRNLTERLNASDFSDTVARADDSARFEDAQETVEGILDLVKEEERERHRLMAKEGWFRIYPAVFKCLFQVMELQGQATEDDCVRDMEGIEVEPEGDLSIDIGGFKAARLMDGLRKAFRDGGYHDEQHEFFWYDWRKYGDPCWTRVQFAKLKQRVEYRHAMHGGAVTLACHSMGCPFVHRFLNTVDQHWKDLYLDRFVATAPAFAGAAMVVQSLVEGPIPSPVSFFEMIGRDMLLSMPGFFTLLPSHGMGDRIWSANPLVRFADGRTFEHGSLIKPSSTSGSFYDALREHDLWPRLEEFALKFLEDAKNLQPPGVKTTCMYITDLQTPRTYSYDFENHHHGTVTHYSQGDGTVNLESMEGPCRWFQEEQGDRYPVELIPMELNQGLLHNVMPTNHVTMLLDRRSGGFLDRLGGVLKQDSALSRAVLDDMERVLREHQAKQRGSTTVVAPEASTTEETQDASTTVEAQA